MWNFAGRQNDIQGNGELEHGNWLTGFSFIDNAMLGDQDTLPGDLKNNKGHNVFYCLPLLLGLIGLFWQSFRGDRGIRQFWVVFFLFFMTGLAIVIYLNQTPMQPRERDYAYAGSFYAFAIWCGLGVAAIVDLVKRYCAVFSNKRMETVLASVVAVLSLIVPVQMASQTWDDHDRSGRYTCRDFGQNYLYSMQDEGNPIIFTNGDNDTFPLWYNQEVEGCRTDTRVCNLSYLQTDWYIDQMARPAYKSPRLPISWPRIDYCSGTNEYIEVRPELKEQLLAFYKENPDSAKMFFGEDPFELKTVLQKWVRHNQGDMHVIPTDTLYMTIDKEAVRRSGMLMAKDSIPDRMVISLKGKHALYKSDLMMLELLASCNWVRPVYVALTVGEDNYMNLGDNFVQEGLANRITPFTTNVDGARNFDTERVYNNMMNRFQWGGLDKGRVYLDETVMRMCYSHRRLFATLAQHLISEGQTDKARKALRKCAKVLPESNVPYVFLSGAADLAKAHALLGEKREAKEILTKVFNNAKEYLQWYNNLSPSRFPASQHECMVQIYVMNSCLEVAQMIGSDYANNMSATFQHLLKVYEMRGGRLPMQEQ